MTTRINESKKLTKHILCECKSRFDGKKYNSDQWQNNDKCRCEYKKRHVCKKDCVWNPVTCNYENGKYLAKIMDDSVIMCDKTIKSYDNETNFNEKKAAYEVPNFTCIFINYFCIIDSC